MPILATKRTAALLLASLAALGGSFGCSLVVESQDRQCEADADCNGFENAVCDVAGGVCIARGPTGISTGVSSSGGAGGAGPTSTSTSTGGEDCIGPDGCVSCKPIAQEDYLNACTDAQCVPYDNSQLDGLLEEDGSLPPVP